MATGIVVGAQHPVNSTSVACASEYPRPAPDAGASRVQRLWVLGLLGAEAALDLTLTDHVAKLDRNGPAVVVYSGPGVAVQIGHAGHVAVLPRCTHEAVRVRAGDYVLGGGAMTSS